MRRFLFPGSIKAFVTCTAFAASFMLVQHIPAGSQGLEAPVTECDRLAAHPDDPDRVVEGVGFEDMDGSVALDRCLTDLQQYPESARLVYQVGRSYQRADYIEKAVEFFVKAAEAGYPKAAYSLGWLYISAVDIGTSANHGDYRLFNEVMTRQVSTGLDWWRRGVDLNCNSCRMSLGLTYLQGVYVERDLAEAERLLISAAEGGDPYANSALGELYAIDGKDYEKSRKEHRFAAEKGIVFSQLALGIYLLDGVGGGKNVSEAADWYRKAAEAGDAVGQYGYAALLGTGIGVDNKDFDRAFQFYEMAAEQGLETAISFLNDVYGRVISKHASDYILGNDLSDVADPLPRNILYYGRTAATAIDWFEKRLAIEDPIALQAIGVLLFYGVDRKKQRDLGAQMIRKAAQLGLKEARDLMAALDIE